MQWLNTIVDELISHHPDGEIVVSSGVSPSGAYHVGTLRELMTAEVVARELRRRGRTVSHIHVSDDIDVFRKVPVGLDQSYANYLGKPLCDIPAPDGSNQSYADFYVADLPKVATALNIDITILRAHEKYRSGYFASVIETALERIEDIKQILVDVSGRKLDQQWSPVQVIEDGYLKSRRFISIQKDTQEITYEDKNGQLRTANYANGEVTLNWRVDWPARWSLLGVQAEPFGRDHATKGGSYDTGVAIAKQIYRVEAPYPMPYDFINKTGNNKKMSKSGGDTITAIDLIDILPPEIIWFFIVRYAPSKLLSFDDGATLIRLFDEFSELLAKPDKTPAEQQLLDICLQGIETQTVSRVPFTHLVASYQSALKDPSKTIEIIGRTEYADVAIKEADIIKAELVFIDEWLRTSAPEDVRFELQSTISSAEFNDAEKAFFAGLADKIEGAPADADGAWFHLAIYEFKSDDGMGPRDLFQALYRLIIAKNSGPRAGWFLSILPRDWLVARLRFEQ